MNKLDKISNTLDKIETKVSTTSTTSNNGIGFCGLLGVVFITLKLLGIINWSWWWVLAPIWIPSAIVIAIVIIIFVCIAMADVIDSKRD